jgi:hypothetical protein
MVGFHQWSAPDIHVGFLATSGFVSVGNDDLPEGSRFSPKPCRAARIVATLRQLTPAA